MMKLKISEDLCKELDSRKINPEDNYEGVIWDLIEDTK